MTNDFWARKFSDYQRILQVKAVLSGTDLTFSLSITYRRLTLYWSGSFQFPEIYQVHSTSPGRESSRNRRFYKYTHVLTVSTKVFPYFVEIPSLQYEKRYENGHYP